MAKPMIVVVGAGPGVGAAMARLFASRGYDVGLVARSADRLDELATELENTGADIATCPVDVTMPDEFEAGLVRLGERHGRIDHLHFNPSATRMADPLALTPAELLADVHLGVASLLTAVQAARPFMTAGARITATGSISADQPWADAASLGVQKAGLRNLVNACDERLRGDGIRAVSVTVRGVIEKGGAFDPERIAEALLAASQQPPDDWRTELPYPTQA
ncbi:MAG: SDR family oxidoreductase [Nocardioidaceae bacterium]